MRRFVFFLVCFLFTLTTRLSAASYEVRMLPPSGSAGQRVTLTCGYHGGSCGTGSGYYLDWDNTSSYQVQFRGIFKRSGSSSQSINYLVGKRQRISGGSNACDVQRVSIVQKMTGQTQGVMQYYHLSMNSTNNFPITVSSSGVYNSKYLGDIINDSGCGYWNGTHVHAGYTTTGSASRYRNTSLYPTGDYCEPSDGDCRKFTNDNSSNWTHRFSWSAP